MEFKKIVDSAKGQANKLAFAAKKNSPTILKVAGGVGAVVAFGYGCYVSYKKLPEVLEKHEERLTAVKSVENPEGRKVALAYAKTSLDVVKIYSGPVLLMTVSLGAMFKATDILQKRNAALGAAYAALDKGYKEYRNRVIERFGEEVDNELLTGTKKETIEETVVDEKGKEKKVKKDISVVDPSSNASPYVKYLTKANYHMWINNREMMMMQLKATESYLTDLLKIDKHLTLNKAYEELGFEDTKAGMVVGWIYDKVNPIGDNEVKLMIREVYIPDENGNYELAYEIDFNVDGNIYERMDDKKLSKRGR